MGSRADKPSRDSEEFSPLIGELKRLVSHPLSPRHVGSYEVLPRLPAVLAVLPTDAGPTRTARAIVEVIADAVGEVEGQTVFIKGLGPLHLDTSTIQDVLGRLLGVYAGRQVSQSTAPSRRAEAAVALGFDLPTLGGDRGFRRNCEPVLLDVLAATLVAEVQVPGWLVERVRYHYSYNSERVLASTDYRYDVISQRDGRDFFINHTAPPNLGKFELTAWQNCDLVEQNQLPGRTVELHFRLAEGAPGSRTHFSYKLRPTNPHMTEELPILATIGQLIVKSVHYVVDFEAPPQVVWTLSAVPPPLAGAQELKTPTSRDDPRRINEPYDRVTKSFGALKVRYFYGIAWEW